MTHCSTSASQIHRKIHRSRSNDRSWPWRLAWAELAPPEGRELCDGLCRCAGPRRRFDGSHTCSIQHGTGFRGKTLVFLTLRLSGELAWWRANTTQWKYFSYSTPFTNRSLAFYKDMFGDRISKKNCFWKGNPSTHRAALDFVANDGCGVAGPRVRGGRGRSARGGHCARRTPRCGWSGAAPPGGGFT